MTTKQSFPSGLDIIVPSMTVNGSLITIGYRYIGTQILTTGTGATYTPTAGTRMIKPRLYGSTGGSGGVDGQGAGTLAFSGAGGNGGYTEKEFLVAGQTFSFTIGAAGVGAAAGANNGTSGGTTSFTASIDGTIQVSGGGGGAGVIAEVSSANGEAITGVGTGGTLNIRGNRPIPSRWLNGAPIVWGGNGSPLLGGGNYREASNGAGGAAPNYSAGALPAFVSDTTDNFAGANGAAGVIYVDQYA